MDNQSIRKINYHPYYQPYSDGRLNIVAIRRRPFKINSFNDDLFVFDNDKISENFKITTLPGQYWLTNLMNPKGCAILVDGFYENTWKLGKHKGQSALVQCNDVYVFRDKNRDCKFDLLANIEKGMFGINFHRAGKFSNLVNSWSAGCQVFQKEDDFEKFLFFCEERKEIHKGLFSYLLLDESEIKI